MGEQRNSSQRRLPGKGGLANREMIRADAVSLVTKAGSSVLFESLESVAQGLHNDLRAMGLSVDWLRMRLTGSLEGQKG